MSHSTDFFLFPAKATSQRLVFILLLIAICISSHLKAQTKIELINADISEFDEKVNTKAMRLIGNVKFRHESALMGCDSAYLFRDENRLEAFGHIRITQGDSMTLTGGLLHYDGETKIAEVFERIVLTDGKMTLHTKKINYNLSNATAFYTDSANIVDNENVLTSKTGYYYSDSKDLYFKKDVLLKNPKYNLDCDTLRYNTFSKTAFFLGPTNITTKESRMYCEKGWYNTVKQTSSFVGPSYLKTDNQVVRGDSIYYDQKKGIGKAFYHVSITDTTQKIIIRGDYAEHHPITDSSWVTLKAEMVQYDEHDSLFLHADTLLAIGKNSVDDKNRINKERENKKDILAYHHVKIYKSDLQGACDSLVYSSSDSTIRFFNKPVLWSGYNQMTADSISLITSGGALSRIILSTNAFLVSMADTLQTGPQDSLRFNQIAGKKMTGLFKDNNLYKLDVKGNGQSIYYALNKKQRSVAVNRADCSDLGIKINKNQVKQINLINDPEGTLYPLKDISPKDAKLKGFSWQLHRRPVSRNSIFE